MRLPSLLRSRSAPHSRVSVFRPSLESLEDRCLLSATLVRDINPGVADSAPAGLVNVQGQLFFAASDGSHGLELWKSDDTTAGTKLVKDLNPGAADSAPASLTAVNGNLFFTASDGSHGRQLWQSDGTSTGTVLVKDSSGNSFPSPANLTAVSGTLYFTNSAGYVWKTNGTAAGTLAVGAKPGAGNLIDVNGALFFTTYTTSISYYYYIGATRPSREFVTETVYLWKSDGTANGTVNLKTIQSTKGPISVGSTFRPVPPQLQEINVVGNLFFGQGGRLWESDGTSDGTRLVTGFTGGVVDQLINLNGTLLFTADDGTTGRELWKSDGTASGTVLVADINSGSAASSPADLTVVNGTLFFSADDGSHGPELWKSNGTTAGTSLVADLVAGSVGTDPANLTAAGSTLFFTATDPTHGTELWQSDGTSAGTRLYQDINPGNASSNPQDLTVVDSHLFFTADDGTHGIELWDPPIADAADRLTHYTITDLGTLGGTQTIVSGLNDRGEAAGVSMTAGGEMHAYVWQNGHMTDLGTLGGNFSDADLINDAGQVVGVSTTADGVMHAFLWQKGKMTDLGVADGVGSVGLGLNNRGIAVGELDMADGAAHTFVSDRTGTHDLHAEVTLGGASDTASDINDAGQIVGWSQTAGPDAHAFLYDRSGLRDLGSLAGTWSFAVAINEAGVVAGTSGTDPTQHAGAGPGGIQSSEPLHEHAFVYSGGHMQDLAPVGNFTESQGNWADPDGRVFGSSNTLAQDDFAATVWNHGVPTDINTLFRSPANLVGLGGIAWGNASGQLVGLGLLTSGDVHGFLLTPRAAPGESDAHAGLRADASDDRDGKLGSSGKNGRAAENLGGIGWSTADLVFALLADEVGRRRK